MSAQALEPKLTKFDRRVLKLVPSHGDPSVTVWQVGEGLDIQNLDEVLSFLRGLEHLGYVGSIKSIHRRRVVWWRTEKGDEAIS